MVTLDWLNKKWDYHIPEYKKSYDAIEFDPKTHTYTNRIVKTNYTSVSKLIKSITPPFKLILEGGTDLRSKTARELGISLQDVSRLWAAKNKYITERGSYIHALCEIMIRDNLTCNQIKEKYYTDSFIDSYLGSTYLNHINEIVGNKDYLKTHCEQILYNDQYCIAGQCDRLVEYKDYLIIRDYKTNFSDDLEEKTYGNLLAPFTNAKNNNYTKYAIQLSIYAWMAEHIFGKPVKRIIIEHFKKDGVTERRRIRFDYRLIDEKLKLIY